MEHGERVALGGVWIASLALAAVAINGGSWVPVVLMILFVPLIVWLRLGDDGWRRWRTAALAFPLWHGLGARARWPIGLALLAMSAAMLVNWRYPKPRNLAGLGAAGYWTAAALRDVLTRHR